MASRYTTKNGRTMKRGAFINGVWHCDCDPRQPADKFQTKNGGKNHGRWFYTCQKPQLKRCSFFLWSDEAKVREQSAVLSNSRSEPETQPQTPRKVTTAAQTLPTPDTTHRDPTTPSKKQTPITYPKIEREESFDWSSSADEELTQTADSVSKPPAPPQPMFETPSKAARTAAFTSPGKRSHSEMTNEGSAQPLTVILNNSDDVFTTPATSSKPHGLRSPMNIPAYGQSRADSPTTAPEPSALARDVLRILEPHHLGLPPSVETQLIELLNRQDLRTQGIVKGREIARIAIQTKEKKIADLEARIAGLEGEKEMGKTVIAHLKQDIASSPMKSGRSRGGGRRKSEV